MSNIITIITTKKACKKTNGGQDKIKTVFDLSVSYSDMLRKAVEGAQEVAQSLEGKYNAEAIAQALSEQVSSWEASIAGENTGGVAWASSVEGEQGVIAHNKTGARYMMGYVVSQEVIELDAVRPASKNTRGPRNDVTAVKGILRGKLASNWRMVAL